MKNFIFCAVIVTWKSWNEEKVLQVNAWNPTHYMYAVDVAHDRRFDIYDFPVNFRGGKQPKL